MRIKQKLLNSCGSLENMGVFRKVEEALKKRQPEQKIVLEVGCGNGKYFSQFCGKHPHLFHIGCDVKRDRLTKAFCKTVLALDRGETYQENSKKSIDNTGVNTLFCKQGITPFYEKYTALENTNFVFILNQIHLVLEGIPDHSLAYVNILFPEPEPRRRNWRKRFFQASFLPLLYKKLMQEGKIYLRTDDFEYYIFTRTLFWLQQEFWEETEYCLDVHSKKRDVFLSEYIQTEFEDQWEQEGKTIYDVVFCKKHDASS